MSGVKQGYVLVLALFGTFFALLQRNIFGLVTERHLLTNPIRWKTL